MELLLMIDAAKRASARTINAVVPYFGWARQDRKDKPRVSIGAKLIADLLSVAGIDRLITMDLHADQIQGFFDVPVDHLYASGVILPYLQSLNLKDMVIASPDVGGSKRANTYAERARGLVNLERISILSSTQLLKLGIYLASARIFASVEFLIQSVNFLASCRLSIDASD
jgi:ribose-phosphate pyrophosphokinase